MQGNNYQLDKEPLLEIPIFKPEFEHQNIISKKVDDILKVKRENGNTSALENQINVLVYHLYELSYEEACVIDDELSKEDFERFKIN
jgi:adenine-specific DNA-methyltransferase